MSLIQGGNMALSFYTEATKKWKLDELDAIIDEFEEDIANAIEKANIKTAEDYLNIVLRTSGKVIVTFREILTLCTVGYPDGALSLARNIYEQFITIIFFEAHKSDVDFEMYIKDYHLDYDIQRYKALKYEYQYCKPNNEELNIIEKNLKKIKSDAYSKVSEEYWWTKQQSFSSVVNEIIKKQDKDMQPFLYSLHYTYKRACVALHASCIGNMIRLGEDREFAGIDTSPMLQGHEVPLWFATSSFIMIVGVACMELGIDFSRYKDRLNKLAIFYKEACYCK